MSKLPQDIILDILTRLPAKSIARFKCVCKPWLKLFDDRQFCKLHYDRILHKKNNPIKIITGLGNVNLYSIDAYNSILSEAVKIVDYPFYNRKHQKSNDTLGILGSCNGIVCMRPTFGLIYFWNPSIKEHSKIVPEVKLSGDGIQNSWYNYGFGYDVKNQDYKLVRFECFADKSCGSELMVYSLASNSWSTTPYTMSYTLSKEARPASLYFNGAIHWLTDDSKLLVSFDLGDEIICEIQGPVRDNFFDNGNRYNYVDVLEGFLCVVSVLRKVRGDVWVMKEYGVRESWTQVFTVPQRSINFVYFTPIEYIHNREQVLLSVRLRKIFSNVLVSYNPKSKRARIPEIHGSDPKWYRAYTYQESLFSVLGKHNSDGILQYLDDDQVEQEEEEAL